jgi:hypothetical protein
VLAPAGDRACLEAAVRAGADAVYFGLRGFNARARAQSFDAAALGETMRLLHDHGVRGYVTLNTLVFDDELGALEDAVRACACAGVDALIGWQRAPQMSRPTNGLAACGGGLVCARVWLRLTSCSPFRRFAVDAARFLGEAHVRAERGRGHVTLRRRVVVIT